MKNPVTFSVYEARSVQKRRQIRQIILLSICIVLLLGGIFFIYVLKMKENIDKAFPSGVANASFAATVTPASSEPFQQTTQGTSETGPADKTPDTTAITGEATSEAAGESTESDASEGSDSSDQTSADQSPEGDSGTGTTDTSETTKAVEPVAVPSGDLFIPDRTDLQTITHKIRDAAFHELQKKIQKSIESYTDARVSFYYSNLENNEAFGFNDMEPFVPAGTFALPINLCLYQMYEQESVLPTEYLPYLSGDGSFPESTIPDVAPYDLRTLSYLSLCSNDSIATNMLVRRQGGIDLLNEQIRQISSVVDFRSPVSYEDFSGSSMEGKNRSSAHDLAKFMESFYQAYLSKPEVYQPMFNDLSRNPKGPGIGSTYPSDVMLCHLTGSASDFYSESEVALVFAQEHFVVVVMVECEDQNRAKSIQRELGSYVYQFISFCYAENPSPSIKFSFP
jgi:uncharacterized protein (UPF0333 family)